MRSIASELGCVGLMVARVKKPTPLSSAKATGTSGPTWSRAPNGPVLVYVMEVGDVDLSKSVGASSGHAIDAAPSSERGRPLQDRTASAQSPEYD